MSSADILRVGGTPEQARIVQAMEPVDVHDTNNIHTKDQAPYPTTKRRPNRRQLRANFKRNAPRELRKLVFGAWRYR